MLVELSILLWNVHGIPLVGAKPEEVANFLYHHPADVYALQEVFTNKMHDAIVNAVRPDNETWQKHSGVLTLTRGELISSHQSHFRQTSWSRLDFLVKKGFISTLNNDFLLLVNTHLDAGGDVPSNLVRASQLQEIMGHTNVHTGPFILAGDLNMKEERPLDDHIVKRFVDEYGFKIAGATKTDYILLRGGVELIGYEVMYTLISDHFPIRAKIRYENDD